MPQLSVENNVVSMQSGLEVYAEGSGELPTANAKILSTGAFPGDCLAVLDIDGCILFMNDAGIKLMEVGDFDAVKGHPWTDLWSGAGRLAARGALGEARVGGTGRFRAANKTANGTARHWEVQVSPIPGESGRSQHFLTISRDISEETEADETRRYLVSELEHRVKNTLAIAGAIVNQTFRSSTTMADASSKILGRFLALGHAHDILTRTTSTSASIVEVIEGALAPHRTGEGRYCLAGPDVTLPSKQALSLALAIHELATNAAKYGAFSDGLGRVNISWSSEQLDGEEFFRFDWREVDGPPVTKPERQGFGSRLIEKILASDFSGDARIEYLPSGVHCYITSHVSTLPFGIVAVDQSR